MQCCWTEISNRGMPCKKHCCLSSRQGRLHMVCKCTEDKPSIGSCCPALHCLSKH